MKYFEKRYFILIYFGLLFAATSACSDSQQGVSTDYNRLCQIFTETVREKHDLDTTEVIIATRIKKELPAFFNKDFVYIQQADPDKRYQFIKRLAEKEKRKSWDCEAMKNYYSTAFK